jgi:opacity protein-like surface antigen
MRTLALAAVSLLTLTTVAHAADKGDLVVQAGQFSAIRNNANRAVEGGLEYRFPDQYYGLRPTVGVMANGDGATYGYAGINWDLPIDAIRPFVITPGVKVGGYSHGNSKDLGYGVEFHDSIEVTYRFNSGHRIGAALVHMSNADLGNSNPGTEIIQAVYSFPL